MRDGAILIVAGAIGWLALMVILVRRKRTWIAVLSFGLLILAVSWAGIIMLGLLFGEGATASARVVVAIALPLAIALAVPLVGAAWPEQPQAVEAANRE